MFFLLDRMFLLSFFVVGPETEGGRESPCAAEFIDRICSLNPQYNFVYHFFF